MESNKKQARTYSRLTQEKHRKARQARYNLVWGAVIGLALYALVDAYNTHQMVLEVLK